MSTLENNMEAPKILQQNEQHHHYSDLNSEPKEPKAGLPRHSEHAHADGRLRGGSPRCAQHREAGVRTGNREGSTPPQDRGKSDLGSTGGP